MVGRNVVVIGGSAGAITAVASLLRELPADFSCSTLVALHLATTSGADWLQSIFAKNCRLPIETPAGEQPLEPARVYVARPDHHLVVKSGRVLANRGARENFWRPAIDVLFRSAAVAYDSRVVGVLMSGELDDGTSGLQAIRTCGGVTVVQNPEDAQHPAMLQTALANVRVDHCPSLRELPALLVQLVNEPAAPAVVVPEQLRREIRMIEMPEDAADLTLWAAIRTVEQRANISRMLAEQEHARGRQKRAQLYESRAGESQRHAQALRELHQRRRLVLDESDA